MKSTKQTPVDSGDATIREQVSRVLCSSYFPAFRSLEIDVEQGAVTLSGVVQSFYEKQVAMTSCQHVAGVIALIDRILVEEPVLRISR